VERHQYTADSPFKQPHVLAELSPSSGKFPQIEVDDTASAADGDVHPSPANNHQKIKVEDDHELDLDDIELPEMAH